MRTAFWIGWFVLSVGIFFAGCRNGDVSSQRIQLSTEFGDIVVEVYPETAPLSAGQFLRYIKEDRITGGTFFRTVTPENQPDDSIRIQVVQGSLSLRSGHGLPPIPHETTETTGLRHRHGTVSLARAQPGTANTSFFICIGEQPELDYGGQRNPDGLGFAAFAQVVEGMEVVEILHRQPAEDQYFPDPIAIETITVIRE